MDEKNKLKQIDFETAYNLSIKNNAAQIIRLIQESPELQQTIINVVMKSPNIKKEF
jgi:hypothetical protein